MRVVICGGGVIGTRTAYFLSLRQVEAIVVQRTGVACAASGKPGGSWRLTGVTAPRSGGWPGAGSTCTPILLSEDRARPAGKPPGFGIIFADSVSAADPSVMQIKKTWRVAV